MSFSPGRNEYFFYFISLWVKIYLQIFAYFTSAFYMQLLSMDYIKTMLNFINNRRRLFNFKTFKIVLLATINSIIVTASVLSNLYTVLLIKNYDQSTQIDILIKDAYIYLARLCCIFHQ